MDIYGIYNQYNSQAPSLPPEQKSINSNNYIRQQQQQSELPSNNNMHDENFKYQYTSNNNVVNSNSSNNSNNNNNNAYYNYPAPVSAQRDNASRDNNNNIPSNNYQLPTQQSFPPPPTASSSSSLSQPLFTLPSQQKQEHQRVNYPTSNITHPSVYESLPVQQQQQSVSRPVPNQPFQSIPPVQYQSQAIQQQQQQQEYELQQLQLEQQKQHEMKEQRRRQLQEQLSRLPNNEYARNKQYSQAENNSYAQQNPNTGYNTRRNNNNSYHNSSSSNRYNTSSDNSTSEGRNYANLTPEDAEERQMWIRATGKETVSSSALFNVAKLLPRPGKVFEYRTTMNDPPYATENYIAVDDGNASPKFFRPTLMCVPTEHYLVKEFHCPFAAVLSPLNSPAHSCEEVPIISGRPPVRCNRCRGYISCTSPFTEEGRRWTCLICGMSNIVNEEYFCNLSNRGVRLDSREKMELCKGTVEYDVDALPEYQLMNEKNEPIPTTALHHLFLIDISIQAVNTFLCDYVVAIREALHAMAEKTPMCKVSFITYAKRLHFYNFAHDTLPQYMVPDVDHPFVPLPFSRLCWLEVGSQLNVIDKFLNKLPKLALEMKEIGCVLGAAVKTAMLVLAGHHGGRVIMSAHRYPPEGHGAIVPRKEHLLKGTKNEKELLRPIDGFWTSTANEAARQQISFDLFMFADEYCELVTLSQLCHVSNGTLHYYRNYDPLIDSSKVKASMMQIATEEAGYAAVLRVRCGTGVRVKRYRGHYLSQNVHDMDLASITSSSTFLVEFEHESQLEKKSVTVFQVALLYTTRSGHRRVRVQSVIQRTCNTFHAMSENINPDGIVMAFTHELISSVVNKGPAKGRQSYLDQFTELLSAYRNYLQPKSPKKSLPMPANLAALPIISMCLFKSNAVNSNTLIHTDERVYNTFELLCIPPAKMIPYLYPTLVPLHVLFAKESYGTLDPQTQHCRMPEFKRLLYKCVTIDGVYALCNEQTQMVYLWIGSLVHPEVSINLFGIPDARLVCREGGPGEECFSERLRNILSELVFTENGMRQMIVIHHGEAEEEKFVRCLFEDDMSDGVNIHSFYLALHQLVVNKAYENEQGKDK